MVNFKISDTESLVYITEVPVNHHICPRAAILSLFCSYVQVIIMTSHEHNCQADSERYL
jgi:hypothetical protein